ncbi:MAG: helix-turn-helix domain-containing protein [Panacagrimonas sp.]
MRALRKQSGLTQAQLGHRLGVGQARIAEIENNPAAMSVEQFLRVLSTLGAGLVISTAESERASPEAKILHPEKKTSRTRVPAASQKRKLSGGSHLVSADKRAPDMRTQLMRLRAPNLAAEVGVTSGRNFVIRPKTGTW